MKFKAKTLALALAAGFPLAAHSTDGYFSHGYGMQAKGMGGASTAIAESAFGAATNPATMAFSGNRFEVGVDLFSPRRKASRSGGAPYGLDGAADSDSNIFAVPEIAYNRMVSPNMSMGLTVYGNGGMNTDYPGGQLPSPGACGPATGPGTGFNPQPGPYNLLCGNGSLGVDLMQLIVAPSVAFKLGPDHAIGIAPLFAYQRFEMNGLQPFEGFSTSPGSVTNRGYDDSTGYGVRVGYYGRISPSLAVGAAYATKMRMGEFDKYRGLFAQQGGFDIPSHWSVGVTFYPSPTTLFTAEYQRINYTDAKSVGNPSTLLLQCAGGNLANCLGGSDGAGFGWQDIDVFKLGVQWQQSPSLTLRAGINISDNPVRSENVTINILAPGVVRNHVTLGATWKLDNESAVTGAFMYAFSNDVNGPSLLNNFVPGLNAQEKIEMYQYSIGVQYSRRF
ncbi:MAG: outer membrane protein transport protein [Usitatibacter sp.]